MTGISRLGANRAGGTLWLGPGQHCPDRKLQTQRVGGSVEKIALALGLDDLV